jgi:CHRD domain
MKRAIVLALMGGLLVGMLGSTVSAQPTTFRAVLSGGDEVPARDARARGVATFRLDGEGTELGFRLVVANIENVFDAHIHCGVAGVSGPIGVTLFMGAPGGGRTDGVLAAGQRDGSRPRQPLRLDRPQRCGRRARVGGHVPERPHEG